MDRTATEPSFDPVKLAERIAQGDQLAEARLIRHFSSALTLMLRRLTSDHALSEDIHQETFRVVLEKLRQGALLDPEKMGGFIRGVAKKLVHGHFRKSTRQKGLMPGVIDAENLRVPERVTPLDQALLEEDKHQVRQLLGELKSERDQQVLFRFYFAEQEREEICDSLNMTEKQFNLVLFRARQKFRKLLERDLGRENLLLYRGAEPP